MSQTYNTRIIPFKKEHLEVMDIREYENNLLMKEEYQNYLEGGTSITVIVDGKLICAAGVVPFLNGNADIWLIPSIYIKDIKIHFWKGLKKWLFGVRKELGLTRMQSICQHDDFHHSFMTHMGFKKEGVLEKFHNGEDHAIYGRVKWD